MKQVLQNFRTGALTVEDIPEPFVRPGFVLVRNHYSLISSGTEGGTVKLGQMSLVGKARARPEQVRKVLQVVRTEGALSAYEATMRSLDMPIALGYCCAGVVAEVGEGINDIQVGEHVACGGGGYANHAEQVVIPRNLCVKLPGETDLRHAAFTTMGSIALQGVRVANVRLGENVVIIGMGLLGLITAQILRAAGCNVFGIDVSPARVEFAIGHGFCQAAVREASNLHEQVKTFSGGYGADAVIITAAAPNNDPVTLAGELARYKARVVVVGRTEMNAPRETYLFKELELCTSLAYGPGTGDPSYEDKGLDYPIGYVRWTENRNMAAFVQLVAQGQVQLDKLITHEFDISEAPRAFQIVTGQIKEPAIAVLLRYSQTETPQAAPARVSLPGGRRDGQAQGAVRVGVIGAGSFATNFMVPILGQARSIELRGIASANGVRAQALGKKYGFKYCTADSQELVGDPDTDCVFILTRHDSHAPLTIAALEAGKHVFVEKPLAMTKEELDRIIAAQRRTGLNVMVGFNRRYAGLALKMKAFFADRAQPMSVLYRANVGYRPPANWLHDPKQGGGVIIAEACHFIDFCHWMVGAPPLRVSSHALGSTGTGIINEDNVHIAMTFADGSLATVTYLSIGDRFYSRERVEVYGDGGVSVLEDFKSLLCTRNGRKKSEQSLIRQDKGFETEVKVFLDAVRDKQALPVPFEQYALSMLATLEAVEAVGAEHSREIHIDQLASQESSH